LEVPEPQTNGRCSSSSSLLSLKALEGFFLAPEVKTFANNPVGFIEVVKSLESESFLLLPSGGNPVNLIQQDQVMSE
jgi:hypothetical protein